MPLTTAVRCGGTCNLARAICTALRMPKSPQPGHQSLWISALYSASLKTFSSGSTVDIRGSLYIFSVSVTRSAGSLVVAGRQRHHRRCHLRPLFPQRQHFVELLEAIFRRHDVALGDDHALCPAGYRLLDGYDDLVLAEGAPVELHHLVVHAQAGLSSDHLGNLPGVVAVQRDHLRRILQDGGHLLGGERPHHAELEEAVILTLRVQALERVRDRALGRAPSHDQDRSLFLPRCRAEQAKFLLVGDFAGGKLELVHALLHHLDAVADALGDVPPRVVLVRGGPEDSSGRAGDGPRADAVRGEGVAEVVTIAVGARLVEQAAVDLEFRGVEWGKRLVATGQVLVHQDDHRHLVAVGVIEGVKGVVERLLDVAGRDHNPRDVALAGVQRKQQVALLLAGGQAGRGPAALVEEYDRAGRLGDGGKAQTLGHQ